VTTRCRLAAVLLALAALGTGCKKPVAFFAPVPTPLPTPTPVDDTVAFTRAGALWAVHSDGRALQELAAPGRDEDFWFPITVPDGSGFLVWLSRGDGTQDIARVDLGGRVAVLTDTGEQAQPSMKDLDLDNAPSCSPDGKQIAYSFNGDIWITDIDGNDAQTLISDGSSWCPAWSPDGKQIAYVNGPEGHYDLWVTAVENHDTSQLTAFDGYSVGAPRWSPDGSHILLTRTRGVESDIVEIASVNDPPAPDADMLTKDHLSASGVFSPSGAGILFSSARADSVTWDLYTSDLQGNSAKQITHGGGLSPDWTLMKLGSSAIPTPKPSPRLTFRPTPTPVPTPAPSAPMAQPSPANAVVPVGATVSAAAAPAVTAVIAATAVPAVSPPAAQNTPVAAPASAAKAPLTAATLRIRFSASFDDQDQLDAKSMAGLAKLAKRVRQYPGDSLDVVGPQDGSGLMGLYSSDEERSQARAQQVGLALARLAGMKASAVQAQPYSPPAAGGEPGTIQIYLQMR